MDIASIHYIDIASIHYIDIASIHYIDIALHPPSILPVPTMDVCKQRHVSRSFFRMNNHNFLIYFTSIFYRRHGVSILTEAFRTNCNEIKTKQMVFSLFQII